MAVTQCFAWKQHDGQWAFPDFLRKQSPLLLQVGSAKNWNWIFCFSANRRLCKPCLRLLNGCMPRNRRLPYNEALKHFLILMVYLLIRVEKIEHLVSLIALPSISRKWTGGGGGWGGWRGCGWWGEQGGGRGCGQGALIRPHCSADHASWNHCFFLDWPVYIKSICMYIVTLQSGCQAPLVG